MRILLVNGPNLNTLGTREPEIYGTSTLADIESAVAARADARGAEVRSIQSNSEGALIDWLQNEQSTAAGLIVNAGALTHYGVALRDAISACGLKTVEVHISNVWQREEFRHQSLLSPVVTGVIAGLGVTGYVLAVDALVALIEEAG